MKPTRPRIVVAGLGDTGILSAVRLARHGDVVGISSKPELVSGQELGLRLTRPERWARDYRIALDRYRGLDRVRVVHGQLTTADLEARTVTVTMPDGSRQLEWYDVLIVATGVTNGFWRRPDLLSSEDVDAELASAHERLAKTESVIVIGGGAAAVSSAANIAVTWPDKQVDLYFPGERAIPQHHGRAWATVRKRLEAFGVGVHPNHRAVIPDGFACDEITDGPVEWSTGQPSATADAVLWAIGKVSPNTGWLPHDVLTPEGFVAVAPDLRVVGQRGVFAVGDAAATDPLRSSARNRVDRLLARNVRAHLRGKPLRHFRPPGRRWGSVLGPQRNGLEVFAPNGRAFRFPAWTIDQVLMAWIVRRGIYRGVRRHG